MKKQEFIERYGEEAWERKKEKDKKRYQEHREERLEVMRKYSQEHRTELSEKKRVYYQENISKFREKNSKYRETHKDKIKDYRDTHKDYYQEHKKAWNQNNKDRKKEHQSIYVSKKEGRANMLLWNYKEHDKTDGVTHCTLTREWIIEHIFTSSCVYCGDSDWTHLGCDRIDNSLPHTQDNCVCACGICNIDRQYKKMSVSEFIEYRKTHSRYKSNRLVVEEVNGVKVLKKR